MKGLYLVCDAEGCDHRQDVDDITADMIGTPCPKCGANLLTEQDYRTFSAMMPAFEMAEQVERALGLERTTDNDPETTHIVSIRGDTMGGINIKVNPVAGTKN